MLSTKMHTNVTLFILLIFFTNFCVSRQYYNYTLYRSIPVEDTHLQFLKNLTDIYDVNFWRPPGILYRPVDFVVSPAVKPSFVKDANSIGMYLTTIIENVQEAFDMQTVKPYIRRKMESFDWNNFFRLDDIYQWLKDLALAYPAEMELFSIGKTYEKRDIIAAKIILKGSKNRSTVIIEGGIHAREWIAPAFVTYMIHQILLAGSSEDSELKEIALTYQWYFVPVLNPDGYEYSHTGDRLWRKNRNEGEFGVDLNRNFDYAFGTVGVNKRSKTSDIYCGHDAFSERESQAMAALVREKSHDLEYYLAFHAYGQYMIIPYANTKTHRDNFDEVKQMCGQARDRIIRKYNTKYTIGTAYDTVGYVTSGVSGCWVKEQFRVPYVVTFELRDNGYNGFALPPQKILPTCLETMDGIVSLLTPRTVSNEKLRHYPSSSIVLIFDKIVIIFNAFLFIIVRFD